MEPDPLRAPDFSRTYAKQTMISPELFPQFVSNSILLLLSCRVRSGLTGFSFQSALDRLASLRLRQLSFRLVVRIDFRPELQHMFFGKAAVLLDTRQSVEQLVHT